MIHYMYFYISKSIFHLSAKLLRRDVNLRLKVSKNLLTRQQSANVAEVLVKKSRLFYTENVVYPKASVPATQLLYLLLIMELYLKIFSQRTNDLRKDGKTPLHKWRWIPYFFQALDGQYHCLHSMIFYMFFANKRFLLFLEGHILLVLFLSS